MCGMPGVAHVATGDAVSAYVVRRMTETLVHRGPDGAGFGVRGPVGLGHQRLAVIDLEGGAQPIYDEDRSISVVFNGEALQCPGTESNRRHEDFQSSALPTELPGREARDEAEKAEGVRACACVDAHDRGRPAR
jgi:hypothetical protein